ncbi:MAG: hypothetical protein LBJ21_02435 [Acidobacteriota bacterium]|jgi:hypothetical protein|nr:hypothetical protein [Acidobacteriota bacterium]
MKEQRIHRNIKHVPKVWGVTYSKLFLTLGCGLLITAAGYSICSGTGTAGRIGIICLGGLITAALHGVCWFLENQDRIDRDAPYLKNSVNSQVGPPCGGSG